MKIVCSATAGSGVKAFTSACRARFQETAFMLHSDTFRLSSGTLVVEPTSMAICMTGVLLLTGMLLASHGRILADAQVVETIVPASVGSTSWSNKDAMGLSNRVELIDRVLVKQKMVKISTPLFIGNMYSNDAPPRIQWYCGTEGLEKEVFIRREIRRGLELACSYYFNQVSATSDKNTLRKRSLEVQQCVRQAFEALLRETPLPDRENAGAAANRIADEKILSAVERYHKNNPEKSIGSDPEYVFRVFFCQFDEDEARIVRADRFVLPQTEEFQANLEHADYGFAITGKWSRVENAIVINSYAELWVPSEGLAKSSVQRMQPRSFCVGEPILCCDYVQAGLTTKDAKIVKSAVVVLRLR